MKKLPFKNKYLLAPMEEINDIAFRLLCKKAGAGATYTGMIHPQTHLKIFLDDKPVLQIFCTTTKGLKDFIQKYDSKVLMWDLNLGCPAETARKHGFGSYLRDLKVIEDILKVIRNSTQKPFSIKFRKSNYALKLVELADKYCDAICIHPRTQAQGYSGKPDIEFAKEIKSKTKLPVIYSGNVSLKNAKDFVGFDYVMIGREAIGNPNIFSEFLGKKGNISFRDYLKFAKKYEIPFKQVKFQAMNFTKKTWGAKKIRLEIFKCKGVEGIEDVFSKFIN